ncbi:MAG TPA: cupin domain-containing protein [Blastocatellia bacterium]|nr:cupin domain-containing protein [Blastocatellia bacterium]
MKIVTAAVLLLVAVLPSVAQSPVPVASEPRHHLKFENEYVRVFDVIVPPADATLFHVHANDYLFVSIGDANLKAEVLGGQPGDLILKDGEVRYSKATITHRVTNQSKEQFRNITIEVLKSPGLKVDANSHAGISGHTLVLENDRVRVERLVLEPGQATNMHEHRLSGLAVFVSGGSLMVEAPGQKPRSVDLKPGEFTWREAGVTHRLKNAGKTRFEAVDIEWK